MKDPATVHSLPVFDFTSLFHFIFVPGAGVGIEWPFIFKSVVTFLKALLMNNGRTPLPPALKLSRRMIIHRSHLILQLCLLTAGLGISTRCPLLMLCNSLIWDSTHRLIRKTKWEVARTTEKVISTSQAINITKQNGYRKNSHKEVSPQKREKVHYLWKRFNAQPERL